MIDDLFCFRFFAVTNNKYIQESVLTPYNQYYGNIIKLHYIWKQYRNKKKYDKEIPFSESDLSLLSWYNSVCHLHKEGNKKLYNIRWLPIKIDTRIKFLRKNVDTDSGHIVEDAEEKVDVYTVVNMNKNAEIKGAVQLGRRMGLNDEQLTSQIVELFELTQEVAQTFIVL